MIIKEKAINSEEEDHMDIRIKLYAEYLQKYYNYLSNVEDTSIKDYSKKTKLSGEFIWSMHDAIIAMENSRKFKRHLLNLERKQNQNDIYDSIGTCNKCISFDYNKGASLGECIRYGCLKQPSGYCDEFSR